MKLPTHIPLSYSAISEYENCPFKFLNTQKQLLNKYPFKPTPATEKGNRMHKAFEDFIKYGKPLPDEFAHHQYFMSQLRNAKGVKQCETRMALDWNQQQVDYFKGKNIWLRGQYDLMIINGDSAVMIDYKTGSAKYPKVDQLQCMSMMAFHYLPNLHTIKASLIFVEEGYQACQEVYTRDKMQSYVEEWKGRAIPIMQALQTNVWEPRENPLCRFCPVVTCPHNKAT